MQGREGWRRGIILTGWGGWWGWEMVVLVLLTYYLGTSTTISQPHHPPQPVRMMPLPHPSRPYIPWGLCQHHHRLG